MAGQNTKKEFLESYDQYADAIYRHCVFRVFSKEKAEDTMQETFTRLWQYMADGKHIDNVRALLYRIATNLIIDESRKKKEYRLEEMLEASPGLEPSHDESAAHENRFAFKEMITKMNDLKDDERTVLTMRYVDDLTPKEIAEILHTNANNISVRLNRAMKALKKHLNTES